MKRSCDINLAKESLLGRTTCLNKQFQSRNPFIDFLNSLQIYFFALLQLLDKVILRQFESLLRIFHILKILIFCFLNKGEIFTDIDIV